jgi:hypothetical protein
MHHQGCRKSTKTTLQHNTTHHNHMVLKQHNKSLRPRYLHKAKQGCKCSRQVMGLGALGAALPLPAPSLHVWAPGSS